jgi:hypothetical protein
MSKVLKKTKKKWYARMDIAQACLSLSRGGQEKFSAGQISERANSKEGRIIARHSPPQGYDSTNVGQRMRYIVSPTNQSGISFTRNRSADSRIYFVTCEEELEDFIHMCNRMASNPGGAPNAQ